MELKTGENDHERRLDRILRRALPQCPLSLIHRLLRQGKIRVDGRRAKPDDRIPSDAIISIPDVDISARAEPGGLHTSIPPKGSLEILREADGLLIVNKPAGLAVHGPGSLDTLVQMYLVGREQTSLSFRAGPLHRLDKPTSGITVFSSSLDGARRFSALMRESSVRKYYLAIMEGCLERAETWQDSLTRDTVLKKTFCLPPEEAARARSSLALTRVQPLAFSAGTSPYTLALAEIQTGKTHQIRCQSAARGFPLAADVKYGGKPFAGASAETEARFFLHAWKMEFDGILLCAPPPENFIRKARTLFGNNVMEKI